MAMGEHLDLPAVRKEQRRVAALLQVDADPPRHKKKRKPLAAEMYWCSYLDPEGKHRNPALDYIRQAFHMNPKMSLNDLKKGFRYVKERNDELFNKKEEDISGVEKKRNRRRNAGSRSVDFDQKTKHRDKENDYKNMRNNLSKSLDGLKLPNIDDNNRIGRRKQKEGDEKARMLVRLPKEDEDAFDDERRRHPEFLRRKKGRDFSKSRGWRKGRRDRGRRHGYDGDSAYEDMSDDEYVSDPRTLLSDSGMAGTPSEQSEVEPFLRYSHGSNPNPDGEEYINRRLEEDARLMKITSLSEKSFCSCGSGHQVAPCPECHQVESHSKKCSRRRRGRGKPADGKRGRERRSVRDDIDNPQTLIGEREPSERCLKCGKLIKHSRETSHASGMGRSWSRDSSDDSGSYRRVRSSSESRIGTSETGGLARSRSVSPPGSRGRDVVNDKTPGELLLDSLERKLREGVFDYDINVRSVDDIDQTLRIPRDGTDGPKADDNQQRVRKPKSKMDIYRNAYIKALSVARSRNLPSESWMLGNRTSKAFVFSYYHYIPRRKPPGDEVDKDGGESPKYELPKVIKKRGAEMKMIFGKENPDDYLPGGPKNIFEPNPLAYVKHERSRMPKKGQDARRRVQEARPSDMKSRKVDEEPKEEN